MMSPPTIRLTNQPALEEAVGRHELGVTDARHAGCRLGPLGPIEANREALALEERLRLALRVVHLHLRRGCSLAQTAREVGRSKVRVVQVLRWVRRK